jgi:hypothetical protein
MPRRSLTAIAVITALVLTAGLSWFAIRNFNSAAPTANDSLRGVVLPSHLRWREWRPRSLTGIVVFISEQRNSFMPCCFLHQNTIYHSNPELIGSDVGDDRYKSKAGVLARSVYIWHW